ncbi:hypothetical protein [Caloramator proteoclasticus]|uniref:Uncharacterized protein n=1 Tax=Caloramator proteoclasticus DSM 10124 TaxID=1121262 RepID=A0A1M4XN38_9CLOT|nr:hypothetical protein [Caloramator proteoclasticus]SHE94806.1 hypothetical protein SAMN02746091_01449 [Caloramator proteoclasticus DSM 10124]
MEVDKIKKFEEFFTNSFRDGKVVRELRLSSEEVEYIRKSYPNVQISKLSGYEKNKDKNWYTVKLGR